MPIINERINDAPLCQTNVEKNRRLKLLVAERIGEEIISVTRYESGWEFEVNVPENVPPSS